jgi:hypothetical protein
MTTGRGDHPTLALPRSKAMKNAFPAETFSKIGFVAELANHCVRSTTATRSMSPDLTRDDVVFVLDFCFEPHAMMVEIAEHGILRWRSRPYLGGQQGP